MASMAMMIIGVINVINVIIFSKLLQCINHLSFTSKDMERFMERFNNSCIDDPGECH